MAAVKYDVVVGLPSLNEEEGISFVAQVVDVGCQKYFSGMKCLILNADCKSTDRTKEVFLETTTVCEKEYRSTEIHAEGKGAGLRLVFERMVELDAPMGFCVDTDLKTITPEWVRSFADALKAGYDMATPRYSRHRCDGTITNLITHPVVSALFSRSVRQPIGGDFGFSLRAAKAYLEPEWQPTTKKYGIDIFMTTTVLKKDYRLAEVELPAKIHAPSLPKLVGMVEQVVGSLLAQLKTCQGVIQERLDQPVQKPDLVKWGGGGDMSIPEIRADPSVLAGKAKELFAAHTEVIAGNTPKHIIPDVKAAVERGTLDPETFTKLLMWAIKSHSAAADAEAESRVVRVVQLAYLLRASTHLATVRDISNEAAEKLVAGFAELCSKERETLRTNGESPAKKPRV